MNSYKKPSNEKLVELFRKHLGRKSHVAEALKISRTTLDAWIRDDSALAEAIEAQGEANIDYVESKLFELIEGVTVQEKKGREMVIYDLPPNVTAIIFFLKTKGKSRGYVERQEITGADGRAVPISVIEIVKDAGQDTGKPGTT